MERMNKEKKAKQNQSTAITKKDIQLMGEVLELYLDPDIPDDTLFIKIKERAFKILPKERMLKVIEFLKEGGDIVDRIEKLK